MEEKKKIYSPNQQQQEGEVYSDKYHDTTTLGGTGDGGGVMVTTVAGSGTGNRDGMALKAEFLSPVSIAYDSLSRSSYIADHRRIRLLDHAKGFVSTFVAQPQLEWQVVQLFPSKFRSVDRHLICCTSTAIFIVSSSGNATQVAGGTGGGYADGTSSQARFDGICGLAFDSQCRLVVADYENHRIRRIDLGLGGSTGVVITTLAGSESESGYGKGGYRDHDDPLQAQFDHPSAVAIDKYDNILVGDAGNRRLRFIDAGNGKVSTLAGSSEAPKELMDGRGEQAAFGLIRSLVYDSVTGLFFIADHHSVRCMLPQGDVLTLAGEPHDNKEGYVDGAGTVARFHDVRGMEIESAVGEGTQGEPMAVGLLLADAGNSRIRRLTLAAPKPPHC